MYQMTLGLFACLPCSCVKRAVNRCHFFFFTRSAHISRKLNFPLPYPLGSITGSQAWGEKMGKDGCIHAGEAVFRSMD